MARDNQAFHLLTGALPAAPARVAVNNVAFTILAANQARTEATIYYEETGVPGAYVSVKLGSAAGATDYSFRIFPGILYSLRTMGLTGYNGVITGIGDAASGFLQVQEHT